MRPGAAALLGRAAAGEDAIAILYLDEPLPEEVKADLEATGLFQQVKPLEFEGV